MNISTELEEAMSNRTAGVPVNERSALSVPFIYRGVDILSSKIAGLPRYIAKKKTPLPQHPASRLLTVKVNDLYPCYTAIKTIVGHAVLHGNGYGVIMRDEAGAPVEIYVVNPRMTFLRYVPANGQGEGKFVYQITVYKNEKGQIWSQPWLPSPEQSIGWQSETTLIPAEDMFHLRGLGDGLTGYSLLQLLNQAIGEQVALQEYTNSFFSNGCNVSQALKVPPTAQVNWKDQDAVARYRRAIEDKHRGPRNANRLMFLFGGAELAGNVGLSPKDCQMIEQRQFGLKLISATLGVPVYMLDGSGDGMSQYGSEEARSRNFLSNTVQNWIDGFKAEAHQKFLTEEEKDSGDYELCTETDKLIELDVTTRRQVLWGDLKAGIITQDEAREELGREPLPKPAAPQIAPVAPGQPPTTQPDDDSQEQPQPPQDGNKDALDAARTATVKRLVLRLRKSVANRRDATTWLASHFEDYHRNVLVEALQPFTADADVIVDDLLPNLSEELQATTRDKWEEIFTRTSHELFISLGK